ncbi:MAG: signal peptide peptidase SppA [Aerococcus sp.]|nr:signal peptide peptidase SppA [Aerococcus sp.]
MNRKRWVLIILGLVIFIAGGVSALNHEAREDRAKEQEDALSSLVDRQARVIRSGDKSQRIVVLPIEGTITSNSSAAGLFGSGDIYNQQSLLKAIERIKKDDTVKGLILDVDSPGGETYASVEMYDALKELKEEKQIPIYVNMKSTAASGAYLISMVSDKIYAHPETITGSIGVIMESMNYKKFLEDHGIKYDVYKSGNQKDMGAPFKDASDEDKKIFQSLIDESYNRFVDIVAEGRHMKADEVKKLADGRIYTASQAKSNGLVDEIGDRDAAIDALMKEQKLTGAEVDKVPRDMDYFNSFWDYFSEMPLIKRLMCSDDSLTTEAKTVQMLMDKSAQPRLWSIYGGVD